MKHYDLLIIGAGTAGLSAAKEAAKYTNNFAIVESGSGGTLCASMGCMPSKALIAAAKNFHYRNKFDTFGIQGAEALSADIPKILKHVRTLRDHFVKSVKDSMQKYEIIKGKACLQGPHTVKVGSDVYQAKAILICTGSIPRIPDVFQPYKEELLTTDALFEQNNLPKSLAIVGTGNIGVELGQALARLGIAVTMFGRSDNIAGITDPDIKTQAQTILGDELDMHLSSPIKSIEKNNQGFCIHSGTGRVTVDNILVSTGRVSNLQGLGLEALDIEMDDRGVPVFDKKTLKIKGQPIYVAGDANADHAILHEAADEGKIAARHALGKSDAAARRIPLGITFTDPPIVKVGVTYDSVKEQDLIIGDMSYQSQGRAVVEQENRGRLRLYATKSGILLGAEMMAPAADHFGHLLSLAIQERITIPSLLNMPFYHPVLEEGLRTALRSMQKQLN